MVVAETLAGIALVNSAVKGIKSAIGTAKDISDIAEDIDNLFKGEKQVRQEAHPVVGKWDALLRRTIGKTADKFSIGTIAKETIEEKLAEEQVFKMRLLIDRRFGVGTWDEILEERKARIKEHNAEKKRIREEKKEKQDKFYKILETVLGLVAVIGAGLALIFYIHWIKKYMEFTIRDLAQFGAIAVSLVGAFITARIQIKTLMEKMNLHEDRLFSMDNRLDQAESARAAIDIRVNTLAEINSVKALEKRNVEFAELATMTRMLSKEVDLLRKLHNGNHPPVS